MSDARPPLPSPPAALRERLAQLLMVRIGSNLPPPLPADADEARVAALLDELPVGGLILFNGTKASTPQVLARLQARSLVPLLVGSDIERGVGQQMRGYTLFPHAAALGRSASGVGFFIETVVREAREAGIHITFAPVADVDTNRHNPIISIRAFGGDPARVAELTADYVRLAEASGLLTTAKHFPGHGDTQQDSHDAQPSVDKSRAELQACELLPFQAAIEAGASLIMTAHVAFPQLDPSGLPATLSPRILQDLLRGEMGFRGVVCSDSLLMAGVGDLFSNEGEMALAAVNAGVDLLLDVKDPVGVVDYLADCVAKGTLSEQRIDEACGRIWTLKQKAFASRDTSTETAADSGAAARIAREAIEVLGERHLALPLDPEQPLVAVMLKPIETAIDPPQQPLAAALQARFRDVQYFELGPGADAAAIASAREAALAAPQLVVAMTVRPAAWHTFGLRAPQAELLRQLTAARPTVVASLGVPQVLDDFPAAAARICTYSDVAVSQEALAKVLSGGAPAR